MVVEVVASQPMAAQVLIVAVASLLLWIVVEEDILGVRF